MKIAVLFRGPIRLDVDTHVKINRYNYKSIKERLNCNVEPYLLGYTKPVKRRLEGCLDFKTVLKVKEPSENDNLFLSDSRMNVPFKSGHSRINAFKQYFAMQQWVASFERTNYDCTHVFYCRTDVAVDIVDKNNWLTSDGYSTAHAKNINGAFTCDYVGCAPVNIFTKVWNTTDAQGIVRFLVESNQAEELLDYSITKHKIRLYTAPIRFGEHIIRTNEDWVRFKSKG